MLLPIKREILEKVKWRKVRACQQIYKRTPGQPVYSARCVVPAPSKDARPLGRHGRSVRDFSKVENIELKEHTPTASLRPSTAFHTFGMSDRKAVSTNCRRLSGRSKADGGGCGTPDPVHEPPLKNVVTAVPTQWARSLRPLALPEKISKEVQNPLDEWRRVTASIHRSKRRAGDSRIKETDPTH
ncbi:hypothetical protein J6590_103302 [Homalodisca vitripennis]|nr:hypothetical protein J6590_103302 [Homalodisca vitripennis]